MFSLNQSQNTLKQVKITVALPPSNITYTGNPINETIQVSPSDAVYSIKDSQGNTIKISKGNATLNTGTELNMGVNNGDSATYSIHPLGDENYTYVLDNQQFVTGTLTIVPLAISSVTWSISSHTTSAHNNTAQSVTVSSIYPTGATYNLVITTATNVGSVASTILTGTGNYSGSFTSLNLTIGAPSAPTNFTASVSGTTVAFSWDVVPGCKYYVYGKNNSGGGDYTVVAEVAEGSSLNAYYTALLDSNYTFYVIAQTLEVPTNSVASRVANVYTGKEAWYTYPEWSSDYSTLSPLCLTGTKAGSIGLKNWTQGTNGITINSFTAKDIQMNPAIVPTPTVLMSSTRAIRWNLNGFSAVFPSSVNPSPGPYTKTVKTTGIVTYTLVASLTEWSKNNIAGVDGPNWAQADWKNDGIIKQLNPAIPSSVSYI